MRLTIGFLTVLIVLTWGAYRLWQEPRVRDLFGASGPGLTSRTPLPLKNKLVVVRSALPAQSPTGKVKPILGAAGGDKAAAAAAADPATEDPLAGQNRVDNGTVERVLLQILASKNLAAGVTLGVTDEYVQVAGTVGSEESRRQILDIIEGGRGARKIDAKDLIVRRQLREPVCAAQDTTFPAEYWSAARVHI